MDKNSKSDPRHARREAIIDLSVASGLSDMLRLDSEASRELSMRRLIAFYHHAIEHFCKCSGHYLTNDASRDACIAEAVAAERDACAVICDTTPPKPFRPSIEAAHAIRQRGNAQRVVQGNTVPRDAFEALERERDHWRSYARTMEAHAKGECWYWMGDGEDHLESLVNSLPVVIRADQLRELLEKTAGEGEPFGYFRAEPFGWTNCSEHDEGAIALYDRPLQQAGKSSACQSDSAKSDRQDGLPITNEHQHAQPAEVPEAMGDEPELPHTIYGLFYEEPGSISEQDEGYQEFLDEAGYTADQLRTYAKQYAQWHTTAQAGGLPEGWQFRVLSPGSITVQTESGYSCTLWKSGHGGVEALAYQMADMLRKSLTAAPQAPALDAGVVRDAERYRWLRDRSPWTMVSANGLLRLAHRLSTDFVPSDDAEEYDAAIDAAMSAQAGGDK